MLPRPEPLEGPLPLVHPRMGIYKPSDLEYATAIITMLRSRYQGDRVTHHRGGSWDVVYHQQDAPPGRPGGAYANTALHASLRDHIPVGVLQEREVSEPPRMFEVLGLAMPVAWQSDYFVLQSVNQAGSTAGRGAIGHLLATAEALEDDSEQQSLPADDYDARLRTIRQIVARRGQTGFRAILLEAYSRRCAITGCDVPDVLEAAHLRPYRGPDSNNVRNGLLLRADIHTLLDLRLLAIEPNSRTVVIADQLTGTHYQHLIGTRLGEPRLDHQRPAPEILETVWRDFTAQE